MPAEDAPSVPLPGLGAHALEDLLAVATHELRSDVTVVSGYLQVLLERDAVGPQDRPILDVAVQRAGQLQHLVDGLFDLARSRVEAFDLTRTTVDLDATVRATLEPHALAAGRKGLVIECACEAGSLSGDPTMLRRVIDNLLGNAVKYTPAGGRIQVRARRTPQTVLLSVTDTGIGIPAGELPRIFDQYFRASTALVSGEVGSGIGLALCEALVRAHGGTISATSAGTGTEVVVELPHGDPAPEAERQLHELT